MCVDKNDWLTLFFLFFIFNSCVKLVVLFFFVDRGETVTINPQSGIANEHHLEYFRFAGRLLGKAFFDSQLVGCHLALPIYKHLLAMPITFHDLEVVDADLVSGLVRCRWWWWWWWCC